MRKGGFAVIIIGVYNRKRLVNHIPAAKHRVSGTPRLCAVGRTGKALGQFVCFLENIFGFNHFFNMLCGNRFKILFNSPLNNKNDFIEACLYRVINRVIKQYFTVFAYRRYLL